MAALTTWASHHAVIPATMAPAVGRHRPHAIHDPAATRPGANPAPSCMGSQRTGSSQSGSEWIVRNSDSSQSGTPCTATAVATRTTPAATARRRLHRGGVWV